jgi:hypothetical protein
VSKPDRDAEVGQRLLHAATLINRYFADEDGVCRGMPRCMVVTVDAAEAYYQAGDYGRAEFEVEVLHRLIARYRADHQERVRRHREAEGFA